MALRAKNVTVGDASESSDDQHDDGLAATVDRLPLLQPTEIDGVEDDHGGSTGIPYAQASVCAASSIGDDALDDRARRVMGHPAQHRGGMLSRRQYHRVALTSALLDRLPAAVPLGVPPAKPTSVATASSRSDKAEPEKRQPQRLGAFDTPGTMRTNLSATARRPPPLIKAHRDPANCSAPPKAARDGQIPSVTPLDSGSRAAPVGAGGAPMDVVVVLGRRQTGKSSLINGVVGLAGGDAFAGWEAPVGRCGALWGTARLGVYSDVDSPLRFLDTPGLHYTGVGPHSLADASPSSAAEYSFATPPAFSANLEANEDREATTSSAAIPTAVFDRIFLRAVFGDHGIASDLAVLGPEPAVTVRSLMTQREARGSTAAPFARPRLAIIVAPADDFVESTSSFLERIAKLSPARLNRDSQQQQVAGSWIQRLFRHVVGSRLPAGPSPHDPSLIDPVHRIVCTTSFVRAGTCTAALKALADLFDAVTQCAPGSQVPLVVITGMDKLVPIPSVDANDATFAAHRDSILLARDALTEVLCSCVPNNRVFFVALPQATQRQKEHARVVTALSECGEEFFQQRLAAVRGSPGNLLTAATPGGATQATLLEVIPGGLPPLSRSALVVANRAARDHSWRPVGPPTSSVAPSSTFAAGRSPFFASSNRPVVCGGMWLDLPTREELTRLHRVVSH